MAKNLSDDFQLTPSGFYREACGGKGIRTPDLLIANETLYQLSYTPNGFMITRTLGGSSLLPSERESLPRAGEAGLG